MKIIDAIKAKIFSTKNIQKKVLNWKKEGKTIVFTNGCFDILHMGHVDYLAKARSLGDILIIGLNTDTSVRNLKGQSRPINDENARAFLLAAFSFVDAVVFFNEETPYHLIAAIKPHFLVKGKDYKAKEVVGYDIIKANGGKVKTIKLVEGYSTSAIEKRILSLNK